MNVRPLLTVVAMVLGLSCSLFAAPPASATDPAKVVWGGNFPSLDAACAAQPIQWNGPAAVFQTSETKGECWWWWVNANPILPSYVQAGCGASLTLLPGGFCLQDPPERPEPCIECEIQKLGQMLLGNPVSLSSGSKWETATDFTTGGTNALEFKRYYRSEFANPVSHMGRGWSSTYDRGLKANNNTSPSTITILDETGGSYAFTKSGANWGPTYSDNTGKLVEITAGSAYEFTNRSDRTDRFELVGTSYRLTQARWRNGYQQDLAYDANDDLATVTDTYGRTLSFTWNVLSGGVRITTIASVTAVGQYSIQYTYAQTPSAFGSEGIYANVLLSDRLIKVQRAKIDGSDAQTEGYLYQDPNTDWLLTGKVDGKGQQYATFTYDLGGRVTSSQHAGGADAITITYDDTNHKRTVTNALGQVSVYTFQKLQGIFKLTQVDRNATATTPAAVMTQTYDTNGYLASQVDWKGNVTNYVRDALGRETSRTEAYGTPQARTITTTWHTSLNVPTQIVEPNKTTVLTWNATTKRLDQRTETDTTPGASGATRTWTFTYATGGLLASVNGPRTDVTDLTTFGYNAQGALTSVASTLTTSPAVSLVTDVTSVNERGLPLSISDPNGVVTNLTYDAHGRLKTSTVVASPDAVTRYYYDANGQVSQIVLPTGQSLAYEYDAAHRLTAVKNSLGERIEYTLDGLGGQTSVKIKDSAGTIKKQLTQTYDALGRLLTQVGAASQTTAFEYDKNSNLTKITDPRSAVTQQAFDPLDRLITSTDALTKVTGYTYDARDNLKQVTDAKSQLTKYTVNAWGDVTKLESPDTGITTFVVDGAGNVTSSTDARSVVTNYTYDALNRILTKSFPSDTTQNVTFGYDSTTGGNKGKGRLTSLTDAAGTAGYIYDARGNLLSETRIIGSVTYQTLFQYDANGNIAQIQYPSGRIVTYKRDGEGRIASVSTQASPTAAPFVVNQSVTYMPFGPFRYMAYQSYEKTAPTYDADYRISTLPSYESTTYRQNLSFGYDAASNITSISDAVNSTRSQTFQYDLLGRLTQATGAYGTETYAYDDVGNRTSRTITNGTTTTVTYTYVTGKNRLASASNGTTTRAFTYDNNGNIATETLNGAASFNYTYNAANRLSQVAVAGGDTFSYKYNAFGERVIRTALSGTIRHYQFGPDGELLQESDGTGAAQKQYIYVDGRPVAVVLGSSSGLTNIKIDDNGTGAVATGTWGTATAGSGYEGASYRLHAAPSPAAGNTVDNSAAGFSSDGVWSSSTTGSGIEGSDYLIRNAVGTSPTNLIVDDADAGFALAGTWSTNNSNYNNSQSRYGSTYRYKAPNEPSPNSSTIDDVAGSPSFTTTGTWTGYSGWSANQNHFIAGTPEISPSAIIIDNTSAGFSTTSGAGTSASGTGWTVMTDGVQYGTNYLWHQTNGPSTTSTKIDQSSANFSSVGTWTSSTSTTVHAYNDDYLTHDLSTDAAGTQTLDNNSLAVTGTWTTATSPDGFFNTNFRTHAATASTTDKVTWTPTISTAGNYDIWVYYPAVTGAATNATFTLTHAGSPTNTVVNLTGGSGGNFKKIISNVALQSGDTLALSGAGNGVIVADAMAVTAVGALPITAKWNIPVTTTGQYRVFVRWPYIAGNTDSVSYVTHSDDGDATKTYSQYWNGSYWQPLGTFNMSAAGTPSVRMLFGPALNSSLLRPKLQADAIAYEPISAAANTATWTPTIATSGQYRIYVRFPKPDGPGMATYTVTHAGGTSTVTVDQAKYDGDWIALGTYQLTAGAGHKVTLSDRSSNATNVSADAVAFEPVSVTTPVKKAVFTPTVTMSGPHMIWMYWPNFNPRATNALVNVICGTTTTPITVNLAGDPYKWTLLGTVNMAPGQNCRVELTDRTSTGDLADGWVIADAVAVEAVAGPGNTATWTPTLPVKDTYEVYAHWVKDTDRATDARYTITHAGGTTVVNKNQQIQDGQWVSLGTYVMAPGAGHKIELSDHANGVVVADAVKLVSSAGVTHYATWTGTAATAGSYQAFAKIPVGASFAPDAKYALTHGATSTNVTLDQSSAQGWKLLGTQTLAAGEAWSVKLSDQATGQVAADAVAMVPAGTLDTFTWTPTIPSVAPYAVFAKWPADQPLAKDAVYTFTDTDGSTSVTLDQSKGGGQWQYVGTWTFAGSKSPKVTLKASLTGPVVADALIFAKGADTSIDAVLADHLNQPQKLLNESNAVTWDRVSTPFGETFSQTNSAGIDQALRFPGQQADASTGLFYNYFRDYDPSLGRYMQSDPVGLEGGINTYAYVGGNPVRRVDRYGLAAAACMMSRVQAGDTIAPCSPIGGGGGGGGAGAAVLVAGTAAAAAAPGLWDRFLDWCESWVMNEGGEPEKPAWQPPQEAIDKIPTEWGGGVPNKKKPGTRWRDPNNPGNGVRIDQGNPGSSQPSQQGDHVRVDDNGKAIGRDGKPINGPVRDNPDSHIPLDEWTGWGSWNKP